MSSDVDQNFINRFSEAEKLCNEGKLLESLKEYNFLLDEHPNHVSVLNNMGLVHEKLGDFDNAIKFYKKCHQLMPDIVVLINNLANVYIQLNMWSEAYPLLKKIIDVDFDHENNAEKYALCLFNLESKEKTRLFIESVISKYPNNKVLSRLLGRSLLHLNAHCDGLKHLQTGAGCIEFDPSGVKYLN